ncbi:ankyrin repeat protein [Pedobacter cryoconitis]|uniref:ankyrin repeat domain-containing protein n=1 Tax=Pedobacter cryoconitis TaxID=188932 RepID=UPI00160CFD04|nr:ankyrin repeat domain-containing protein [Pedobacter cryoconitis]MBB6272131.1 ankyrin repeat protein [Pedobacter cryoconitis]
MRIESEIVNAIQSRDFEKAKTLLQSGEKISKEVTSQPNFRLPFSQVIRAKEFEIIDLWIADKTIETDVYEYDSFRDTIFDTIIREFPVDEDSIAWLDSFMGKLDNINDEIGDITLLGYALENGADVAVIKCLIDAGCDVNYTNNAEQSFLYEVVNKRMMAPEKAIAYMEVLIGEGLDVNKGNVVRETPLMVAVSNNKVNYLDLLLENGADPNEQDQQGKTAFYRAVVDQSSEALYDKLAAYTSPDFDRTDQTGNTLLTAYLSRLSNNSYISILPKLLDAGADINQKAPYYDQQKSGLDWLAEKSFETLEIAMATGQIDVNDQDDQGETILHKVCAYNTVLDERIAKEIYKKVKLLIEAGADVNLISSKEETPLMLASNNNIKIKTVQLLMSNSAK